MNLFFLNYATFFITLHNNFKNMAYNFLKRVNIFEMSHTFPFPKSSVLRLVKANLCLYKRQINASFGLKKSHKKVLKNFPFFELCFSPKQICVCTRSKYVLVVEAKRYIMIYFPFQVVLPTKTNLCLYEKQIYTSCRSETNLIFFSPKSTQKN